MNRKWLPRLLLATQLLTPLVLVAWAAMPVAPARHPDAGGTGPTRLWKHWVSAQCPQPEQVEELARYDALVIEPWCWYQAGPAAAIEVIYERNRIICLFHRCYYLVTFNVKHYYPKGEKIVILQPSEFLHRLRQQLMGLIP
jgi:hypothetical protein